MTEPVQRPEGQLDPYHYDIDPEAIAVIDALEDEGAARQDEEGHIGRPMRMDLTDEEVQEVLDAGG